MRTIENAEPETSIELCTALGRALHRYGAASARLESQLVDVSTTLGIPGQFFVTPTAIFAEYCTPAGTTLGTRLVRAEPGGVDLGRLSDLDQLVDELYAGDTTVVAAAARLAAIVRVNGRDQRRWQIIGAGLASAAGGIFLGGGIAEAVVGGAIGVLVGLCEFVAHRRGERSRLVVPVAAALASIASVFVASRVPGFSAITAQIAGLLVLVPGWDFTLAMKEVSRSNLVSGSARLVSALGDLLLLGFGMAFGTRIAESLVGFAASAVASPTPTWLATLALLAATTGFALRFRAHRRDFLAVALGCLVAWNTSRLGVEMFGADLAAFAGALAVGLVANGWGRWSGRTSQVVMVPGLILLVPGSVGLRSVEMLLRHDVVSGLEGAFTMALVATALSTGLLVANSVFPPTTRRPASDVTES